MRHLSIRADTLEHVLPLMALTLSDQGANPEQTLEDTIVTALSSYVDTRRSAPTFAAELAEAETRDKSRHAEAHGQLFYEDDYLAD